VPDPLTIQLVYTALAHLMADALRATLAEPTGTFNPVYVGLFTAWPGFTLGLARTDLTEANFTGYARQEAVFGDVYIDPSGRPSILAPGLEFESTDGVNANRIIGVALYDASTVGNLLGAALLVNPVNLDAAEKSCQISLKLAIPGTAAPDWGVGAINQ